MKGSNKEFARYLAFEYNDEYLQPADDYHPYDEEDISEFLFHQVTQLKKESEPPKPEANSESGKTLKHDIFLSQVPLSRSYIGDLTEKLEQPARDCANNITQISKVEDAQVLNAFKTFHQTYEILPVIFCSYMPEQAVYLWQINRYGPINRDKTHEMLVNVGPKASQIGRYISFLLLAKITSIENEKIIDTKLFGDNQLLVISLKTGDRELIFRLYNVKDFAEITRVNPFNQEILANGLFSFKLSIKGYKNPDGSSYNLEITLSRVQTNEEFAAEAAVNPNCEIFGKKIIIQKIVLEGYPYMFSALKSDFSDIFRTSQEVIVLTDRDTSTVITWRKADLTATHHDFGVIKSLKYGQDSLYVRVDNLVNYELNFGEYPEIKIKEICVPLPSEIQAQIKNYESEVEEQRQLVKSFMEPKSKNVEKLPISVPNIPFPLNIPPKYLKKAQMKPIQDPTKVQPENNKKDQQAHEDEEEKEEEICISDKVNKIRNRLASENSGKLSLEGTKEILKEIRDDVREKKKELINYDKMLKDKSKGKQNPDQELEKPKDVPKEASGVKLQKLLRVNSKKA